MGASSRGALSPSTLHHERLYSCDKSDFEKKMKKTKENEKENEKTMPEVEEIVSTSKVQRK